MKSLQKIFDVCPWDQKFLNQQPGLRDGKIIKIFGQGQESEAEKWMKNHKEVTTKSRRRLWLTNDSGGRLLAITEEKRIKWQEDYFK